MGKIDGCDISAYQGVVNFQKMEDAGSKFVILRKQVGYYGDVNFWTYFENAKRTSLKVGAYGALVPGYDRVRQFAKFVEGISPSDLDFPPFADIEKKTGLAATQGKSKNIADVLDYLFRLKAWWGDAVIYTAKYVWEEFYSSKAGWIDDWDLWVANYRVGANEPYYVPNGWMKRANGEDVTVEDSYMIWQHSADGNGLGAQYGVSSDDIDLDWMKQEFWDKHIVPQPPSGDKPNIAISYNPDKVNLIINEVLYNGT
jgi:GH25 family lysozyme M1 (1,4-beta-N-acetylmuramidase)